VQLEYNDSTNSSNQVARWGITFKHDLPAVFNGKGWLQWRVFPYESDGSGEQLSLGYFLALTKHVSFSGFADLNLQDGADDRWVIEPQLSFKINEHFKFLIEYRYNGFEAASPSSKGNGIAVGVGIKI